MAEHGDLGPDFIDSLVKFIIDNFATGKPINKQPPIVRKIIWLICIDRKLMVCAPLTPREQMCLQLAAKGKTSKSTAKLLGIEKSTVDSYRKQIKQKWKCTTMPEAVYLGIQFGVLQPYDDLG